MTVSIADGDLNLGDIEYDVVRTEESTHCILNLLGLGLPCAQANLGESSTGREGDGLLERHKGRV